VPEPLAALVEIAVGYVAGVCYAGVAMTASRGGYLSVAASLIIFAILGLCVRSRGKKSVLRSNSWARCADRGAIATALLFHSSAVLSERRALSSTRKYPFAPLDRRN
jgi:hypothetical protein